MITDDDGLVKSEMDRKQEIFKRLSKTIYDYVCYRTSQEGLCPDIKFVARDEDESSMKEFELITGLDQIKEYNKVIVDSSHNIARKITNRKIAQDFMEQMSQYVEDHNIDITECKVDYNYRLSRWSSLDRWKFTVPY